MSVAVVLAIGTGVAWAQSVHTDSDPSVNFSSFKTYHILGEDRPGTRK